MVGVQSGWLMLAVVLVLLTLAAVGVHWGRAPVMRDESLDGP